MRYPKDVPLKDPNKTVSLPKTGAVAPNSVTPYVAPIEARGSSKDSEPPVTHRLPYVKHLSYIANRIN